MPIGSKWFGSAIVAPISFAVMVTVSVGARGDVILDWDAVLLDSVRAVSLAPPSAARSMAILNAAICDAVNAATGLALMNECYGMKSGGLHHLMLESLSLDDVGRTYDLVLERKVPLILTLGRHSNDQMTSFYMQSPSSFAIEYGWGGRLIDDSDWRVRKYGSPKLWGHHLVA